MPVRIRDASNRYALNQNWLAHIDNPFIDLPYDKVLCVLGPQRTGI